MRLFSDFQRLDSSPPSEGETTFQWLDRSADSRVCQIRSTLEDWFARYPDDHKSELRSRACDTDDMLPSFLELYVHQLLLGLGYEAAVHPDLPGTRRRPDFGVSQGGAGGFYVEATLVTGRSRDEESQNKNLDALFDTLHTLESPDFFLDLEIDGLPTTPVPGRKWCGRLGAWLREQDYNLVASAERSQDLALFPSLELEHDGFRIVFRPFTKARARGRPGVSPLGTFGFGVKEVDRAAPMVKSLKAKAGQFGSLDRPLVLVADAVEVGTDEHDIMQALFGTERFHIPLATAHDPATHRMTRDPDGLWHAPWGARYTRVSAAVIYVGLHPWTAASVEPCVYINPWAETPVHDGLTRLTRRVPRDGRMDLVEGTHPRELLGLPEEWPDRAAP